jgi:hypothetical protein
MKARPRRGSVKLMLIFFAYHHFFLYEYVSCWLPFWGVGSVIGSGKRASAFYQNLSKLRRLVFQTVSTKAVHGPQGVLC